MVSYATVSAQYAEPFNKREAGVVAMDEAITPSQPCPCGSGATLAQCCGIYLTGDNAPTPEALMRSRYTANALGRADYLRRTWHPSTCPAQLSLADGPQWLALEVRRTVEADATGSAFVEFVAHYRQGGRSGALHETSRFVWEGGQWLYLDGDIHPAPARNAPCPCGSGRKYKRCCASR